MSFSSTAAVFPQQAFMNPGPAPPPPTSNKNNNDENSQRHTPSNSDSSTSSNSPTTNNNSLTHPHREDSNKGKIMKQGWVSVKEDGSMKFMWTKKYLILRGDALDFLKNEVSIGFFFPHAFIYFLHRTNFSFIVIVLWPVYCIIHGVQCYQSRHQTLLF